MTRENTIQANDELRTTFKGGRVQICHGPYGIDDRTLGRMLCALAKYNKFSPDSLHDQGCFIFGGFAYAWRIELIKGERILTVWIDADVLNGPG